MRPVVVECNLAGPLVDGGDPIHLDGLLAAAWARRHPRYAHASRRSDVREIQDPHLPLGRIGVDGASVYLASAAVPVGHAAPAVVHQARRRDAGDWDRLASPVNVTAGPAKDVLLRRDARLVHGLRWYAYGRRSDIRKELKLLWGKEGTPHGSVGGARRSGTGRIVSWSIVHGDHEPAECFVSPSGVIRRHLPAHWLDTVEAPRVGSVRPPYWHPGRRCRTAEVGSQGRLTLAVRESMERLC